YLIDVHEAFGGNIDYGMLKKIYSNPPQGDAATHYRPGNCCGNRKRAINGNPARKDISTSHVERLNLTMRMSMRRYTRLTNAFSKKVENLAAAVSIYFFHYNFCRVHQTLGTTPAVAAGVTDHAWSLDELIGLLGEAESVRRYVLGPRRARYVRGQREGRDHRQLGARAGRDHRPGRRRRHRANRLRRRLAQGSNRHHDGLRRHEGPVPADRRLVQDPSD